MKSISMTVTSVMMILFGGLIMYRAWEYAMSIPSITMISLVPLGMIVGLACVCSGVYALWEDYIKKK